MKVLKKILCCLVVLPVMLCFVACKDDDGNGGGNNPPAELSTAQILNAVSEKVIAVAGENDGDLGYQEDGVYSFEEYDKYVYISAKMIDAVAGVEQISSNVWYNSNKGTLDGKTGYAEKVYCFRLSQTESDGLVVIQIDMVFEIEGKNFSTNRKSFDLWHYEILFDRDSKDVSVDVLIEKSRNYTNSQFEPDNKADYVRISFNEEMIDVVAFSRTAEIYDVDDLVYYNQNTITNFSFLRFNFENKAVLDGSLLYPENSPNMFAKAQSLVKRFVEVEEFFAGANITETNETLTSKLISYANAEKIADIL